MNLRFSIQQSGSKTVRSVDGSGVAAAPAPKVGAGTPGDVRLGSELNVAMVSGLCKLMAMNWLDGPEVGSGDPSFRIAIPKKSGAPEVKFVVVSNVNVSAAPGVNPSVNRLRNATS